jgi:hypothetical protein
MADSLFRSGAIQRKCGALLLALALAGCPAATERTVLAALDPAKIAAAGLRSSQVTTVFDFSVTYLHGAKESDEIAVFLGARPSLHSSGRKLSAEIQDTIAGQSVTWIYWTEEEDGALSYEAEVLFDGTRIRLPGAEPKVEKLHVFLSRPDAAARDEARKLASALFAQGAR